MMDMIAPDHPKQKLLFYVAQDVDERTREDVREFILRLAPQRQWLLGPPRFVDVREGPRDDSRGDLPVITIGGYLEIYSALPPWKLPREVDERHLHDVTTVVNALGDFSHKHALVFEFELDGTFVGAIEDGEMDRTLAEGLLGEWRRQLGRPT